jgi:hypothetical protein
MAKYAKFNKDSIEYQLWLTFDYNGNIRVSRGEPDVTANERAMWCVVTLPISLFLKPQLKAAITIADGEPQSFQIDVQAAGEALKAAIGCDVDLRVILPDEAP